MKAATTTRMWRFLQVPECYQEHLIRFIHHSAGDLDDVAARAVREFEDQFVPGEEAVARLDDAERPCRVVSIITAGPRNGKRFPGLIKHPYADARCPMDCLLLQYMMTCHLTLKESHQQRVSWAMASNNNAADTQATISDFLSSKSEELPGAARNINSSLVGRAGNFLKCIIVANRGG